MKHVHIYYHNDLDGVMSAVMYAKLFRESNPGLIFHYSSVNYGNKNWVSSPIVDKYNSDIVVVDFAYHPQAALWFDHHLSNKGTADKLKEKGIIIPGKFDHTAPSCADVIYNMEGRDKYIDELLIARLVNEVNMIDNAQFKTLDDVYGDKTFGPKMRWAFQEAAVESDAFTKELIHLYVEDRTALYKLVDYNQLPDIAEWRYIKGIKRAEEAYKEFVKFVQQKDNIVYYEVPKYLMCDRYFAFRYNIECDYTVYVLPTSTGAHVGVAKNPWKSHDKLTVRIDVAELCQQYNNGGGHSDVGGIPCASVEEAREIQNKVINYILEPIPF